MRVLFRELVIEREERKGRGGPGKTRRFAVRLLGHATANRLWDCPTSGSVRRPVWVAYFGTEGESGPFTANFRASRKAATRNEVLQIPKKAPFRWTTHRVPGGVITVAYLPELFHLEPASPFAEEARFVFAPPRWWLEAQAADLAPDFGDDALDAARAALFAAYLDRRTRLPLVRDPRFHLQLYRAALDGDWVHKPGRNPDHAVLTSDGLTACGLDDPIAVRVGPEALARFLTEQTSTFHREEIRRGTTRIATDRRLLPDPLPAAAQLRLDFALA